MMMFLLTTKLLELQELLGCDNCGESLIVRLLSKMLMLVLLFQLKLLLLLVV